MTDERMKQTRSSKAKATPLSSSSSSVGDYSATVSATGLGILVYLSRRNMVASRPASPHLDPSAAPAVATVAGVTVGRVGRVGEACFRK